MMPVCRFRLSLLQAMVGADQWFMKEAEASTRAGSTWEFAAVRNSLQVSLAPPPHLSPQ